MRLLSPPTISGLTRQSVCHRVSNLQNGAVILTRTTVRWKSAIQPSLKSSTVTPVHPQFQRTSSMLIAEDDGPSFGNKSFRLIGLEPNLVQALQKAFPDIKRPTKVQESLITEILRGRDILLKDGTGSGKSFGIVLGLLAKPRVILEDKSEGGRGRKVLKHVITSLFIVPHRDLAYQLLHWIESIVRELKPEPNLASIVQVLVRGSEKSHEKSIEEIKETPPHILICTPQAFLEVHKMDNEAVQLDRLSTVVVDEVDYLVPTVVKDRKNSYWKAYEKASKKIRMHPGPAREILDVIYARRKELWENQYDPEEDDERRYNSVEEWRNDTEAEEKIPQLVLSSATLRVHLKDYLFGESGWLNGYNLVKINGVIPGAAQGEKQKIGKIDHSILVVSDTGVRNVDGAVERLSEESKMDREAEEEAEEEYYEIGTKQAAVKQPMQLYDNRPSPFNPVALEAIAAAFALDVPAAALLVLPSSAPVRRAVHELRTMGVNAHGLDLLHQRQRTADPTLLVATLATTRGLDLPSLTHVFVLGIPEGPVVTGLTVDAYLHVSGRVGRFGRRGQVISVVEEEEAAKMARILGAIGEKPVQFKQLI